MFEYRPEWTTSSGGVGYSVLHASVVASSQGWVDAVRTMFNAVAGQLPNDVSISFPGEYLERDTETGTLLGSTAVTPPASVTGSSAGVYAAPAGARIRWNTGAIVAGRRVSGSTFLVPLATTAYQTDGTILAAVITTLQNAAQAYLDDVDMVPAVWSRPTFTGDPPVLDRGGSIHAVQGVAIPDRVAVLRSRRD
jgi:hypothetical protein